MGQQERQATYKKKQDDLGFVKVAVMFPKAYKGQLAKYVATKRRQWELERDA